jgi:hypothetical protein
MAELEGKILQIRRRLTWFFFAEVLARAALVAMVLALVYLVAQRLANLPAEPLVVAAGLVGLSLVVAGVWTWRRRLSLVEAALAADERLALCERLSSALLLHGWQDSTGAVQALEADALRHAAAIQPRRDFQWRAPRALVHLAWPTAAFVGTYLLMPQFDLFAKPSPLTPPIDPAAQQAEERMRKETARELKELARELEEKRREEDLALVDTVNFAKELERLSDDLYLGNKDKRAAVAELSRLEDEVKLQKRDLAQEAEPFKQIKGLQRAETTRQIQQDMKDLRFNDAARRMEQIAQQQVTQMSSAQTEQLANELERLAEELKGNSEMSESLQKSAEALKQLAEARRQDEQSAGQQQTAQQQASPEQQASANQGQQGLQQQSQQQQGQQPQPSDQGQQEQGQQQASQSNQGQQQSQGQPSQSPAGGSPQQQSQQGDQQSRATSDALAQAQRQLQQAAQQMANQQQLVNEMKQLDQVSQQLGQARSSLLNSQSQDSQSAQGGQSGGQQAQGQGGQQGQNSGQSGGQPCGHSNCPPGQCQGGGQGQQGQGQGQGQFAQGAPEGQGQGSGGPGRGQGGNPPDAGLVEVDFLDEMIRGEKNDGEILAVIEIDAPALKGESNVRYTQIYNTRMQNNADAMRQNEIPLGYRNAVRNYFEAINPQRRAAD